MKREIITIGDPILRTKTMDVDLTYLETKDFQALISDMINTMKESKGVGLAAPQVNVSKRILVAETSAGPIALINPYIINRSKKMTLDEEGCLSIPGKFDLVKRFQEIEVTALTSSGENIKFKAKGFFSRVLQHEIDHLDGILYVDRVIEQTN